MHGQGRGRAGLQRARSHAIGHFDVCALSVRAQRIAGSLARTGCMLVQEAMVRGLRTWVRMHERRQCLQGDEEAEQQEAVQTMEQDRSRWQRQGDWQTHPHRAVVRDVRMMAAET